MASPAPKIEERVMNKLLDRENTREFNSLEDMTCPACGHGELEEDGMPLLASNNDGVCTNCGQRFRVKYTMIWKDGDIKEKE